VFAPVRHTAGLQGLGVCLMEMAEEGASSLAEDRRERDRAIKRLQQERRRARELGFLVQSAMALRDEAGPVNVAVFHGYPGQPDVPEITGGGVFAASSADAPVSEGRDVPATPRLLSSRSGAMLRPPSAVKETGPGPVEWEKWDRCQVCGHSATGCPACFVAPGVVLGYSRHGDTPVFDRVGKKSLRHGGPGTFVSVSEWMRTDVTPGVASRYSPTRTPTAFDEDAFKTVDSMADAILNDDEVKLTGRPGTGQSSLRPDTQGTRHGGVSFAPGTAGEGGSRLPSRELLARPVSRGSAASPPVSGRPLSRETASTGVASAATYVEHNDAVRGRLEAHDMFAGPARKNAKPEEVARIDRLSSLLDRKSILDHRRDYPSVVLVIHDPLAGTTRRLMLSSEDTPEQIDLFSAIACERPYGVMSALVIPAAKGPVVLSSRPAMTTSVRALGDMVRSRSRRWLHALSIRRAQGDAAAAAVASFYIKNMNPAARTAWRTKTRLDLAGLSPQFPDQDAVQNQLDWLFRQGDLVKTKAAAESRRSSSEETSLYSREGKSGKDVDFQVNMSRVPAGEEHLLGAPQSVMRAHGLRA
jgi:hypothetical protein